MTTVNICVNLCQEPASEYLVPCSTCMNHVPITYYCFIVLHIEFYNNFTKMLAVSIDLQHSYCSIVFLIKIMSSHFLYHIKRFYF